LIIIRLISVRIIFFVDHILVQGLNFLYTFTDVHHLGPWWIILAVWRALTERWGPTCATQRLDAFILHSQRCLQLFLQNLLRLFLGLNAHGTVAWNWLFLERTVNFASIWISSLLFMELLHLVPGFSRILLLDVSYCLLKRHFALALLVDILQQMLISCHRKGIRQ